MSFALLDDNFEDNPHVVGMTHEEFRLYVCALSYTERHRLCGRLPKVGIEGVARKHKIAPARAIGGLVAKGRWEPVEGFDGWQIHDYDKLPRRKATPEDIRQARAAAGKLGGLAKQANAKQTASKSSTLEPHPHPTVGKPTDSVETSGSDRVRRSDVDAVFDAYCESTKRTATYVRTPERRNYVVKALRLYPLAEVLDAVDGWRFIPHNRGENERHRPFNDLELILKDAKHIETFRDAKRGALMGSGPASEPGLEDVRDVLALQGRAHG